MNSSFTIAGGGEWSMNQRIQAIADAATKLFLQQGYAKTQISHIAKAVGVSVGTIYLDFTGKKEIMQFVSNHKVIFDYLFKSSYMPV